MLHLSGLVVFVVFCALSTACARGGAAPPSRRIGARIRVPVGPVLSRPPPLAHPRAVAVKIQPPSATAAAAAMRVCAGALVVFSLLLGLSTPSSAASQPSTTRSPPASVLTSLLPRLSYNGTSAAACRAWRTRTAGWPEFCLLSLSLCVCTND